MTRYLGHSFINLGPSCFDVHGVKLQTGCEKISLLLIVSNDVILFSLSRKSFRARSIEYCACICKFKKMQLFRMSKNDTPFEHVSFKVLYVFSSPDSLYTGSQKFYCYCHVTCLSLKIQSNVLYGLQWEFFVVKI